VNLQFCIGGGQEVQPDHFSERLEVVRKRFASSLEGKIENTYAELPHLSDADANAADALANAYRRIHGICGVGRTVGFAATGRAAKAVEDVLVGAYHGKRGLSATEMARLKQTLGLLTAAAQAELRSTYAHLTSKSEG
jgi:chemotaxis protein histidine kinase CheA